MVYCREVGEILIVTGILHVIAQILSYALAILPNVGSSLDKFVATSQSFFSYAFLVNGYFPIDVLGICITILWGAHSLEFVGNLVVKLYRLIPGKMS